MQIIYLIQVLISKNIKNLPNLTAEKQSNLKMGRDYDLTCFQRIYPDGQHKHEKMLNINNQKNSNQYYKEISPHTCQQGFYQNHNK